MAKSSNLSAIVLFVVLAVVVLGLMSFSKTPGITGAATTQTTQSRVSITYYYAVTLSANLADGIDFGNITTLPATNTNATDNYNGAGSNTTMWVLESSDSNVNIDLCTRAQYALNDTGGDVIGIGNYTWSDSKTTNATTPIGPPGTNTFTTTLAKGLNNNIAPNGTGYYRYWLNIPVGQPAGNYTNIIEYKAVHTGSAC